MVEGEYTRHIALDGGVNVRDIGGYRSRDGRSVKWRKILRSGHLSHLTDSDRASFNALDLRTVHDFRRSSEIDKFQSAVGDIKIVAGYEMGVGSMGMFMQALERDKLTPKQAHDFVVTAYGECLEDVTAPYKQFFRNVLEQKEGSLLFHCMAGKDRTGLAAALLLHALDIPRDVIIADYMLTAQYLPIKMVIDNFIQARKDMAIFIRQNPATLAPYCGVHSDNLDAFFSAIDALYGSTDAYLSQGLALTHSDIQHLRDRYLS